MANRLQQMMEKLRLDAEAVKRMKQLHHHPLDVLDDLLATMFALMREGAKKKNPDASEAEILQYMRQQARVYSKRGNTRACTQRNMEMS